MAVAKPPPPARASTCQRLGLGASHHTQQNRAAPQLAPPNPTRSCAASNIGCGMIPSNLLIIKLMHCRACDINTRVVPTPTITKPVRARSTAVASPSRQASPSLRTPRLSPRSWRRA